MKTDRNKLTCGYLVWYDVFEWLDIIYDHVKKTEVNHGRIHAKRDGVDTINTNKENSS